ncbi:UPF0481 protein At3g47200 [Manihot esculenta]|uniref:Uncharacterized protein n=1 Tax=Manihot esculenta TaxID=3983 RepID=A0A2C9VU93_MANES|nr:UPF0481 protein At3g47200 [Manihot esculenta]XP_043812803.1 UPF0481 protein At3g47200 [Manihot esculenta]OAY49113.1 hypothetical protein MANES_05G030800v8 [Manihot esculenta]
MESTRDASNQTEDKSKELIIIDNIPQDLDTLISEPALWPELCIYRVPRKLRAINPASYTPQLISVGPFHCEDEALMPMEKQKLRYLAEFSKRTGITWTELANQIKEWEITIRHCYEETFDKVSSVEFIKMILLDSVFIIELFLRRGEKYGLIRKQRHGNFKDDFILGKSTREYGLLGDLILVENQLPYFVLDDLYEFSIGNDNEEGYPSFFNLMKFNLHDYLSPPEIQENENSPCDCFSCLYCFWISRCFSCQKHDCQSSDDEEEDDPLLEKPLHLTDLVRKHRSFKHPKSKNNGSVMKLYNATMLHEAGVKFQASPEAWPLDIKFERGELKMPRFLADDNTERVIRNLMAFEQCHYPNQPLICDYIWVLDFLINTAKDVDLLVRKGIIVNLLGDSEAVAKLVNNLGLEITASGSCFYDLSEQLNKHYENPWCRTVAIMRSVYFSNLWRGTGTIAAIVLLFFTFTQSVYSISQIF